MKVRVGSLPAGTSIVTLGTGKVGVVLDHLQSHNPNTNVGGTLVSIGGVKRILHPDVIVQRVS